MSSTSEHTTAPETHSFQAEIARLLDIVIHSLYTDREIFVRELVSNGADALERLRHELLTNTELAGKDEELRIQVQVDTEQKRIVFIDNGVGMTRDDLSENLGTIARSGTKEFVERMLEAARQDVNLIGQFGVGFYSAFMVAKKVTVETRSFHPDSKGWVWESEGAGSYTIAPREGLERGTRIVLELKDDATEFASPSRIKDIVRRFSNFVPFRIDVNGERVNTIQAIWTRNKSEISGEEYTEFFKFIANTSEEPAYRLHFSADAPLAIHALLFVPKTTIEHFGLGRMEPGVDLYCKKVLIQKHPENLLPEWLRFLRGVIDSDDLPLNISRETMQDSLLIRKISKVITGRFIKFLAEEAKKDPAKYDEFFRESGRFIKEGVTSDFNHRKELAELLRFESSFTEAGKTTSLADYVSRMPEGQKEIYFISGASREAIEAGPYIEALRDRGLEVIYNFDNVDDFVFESVNEYDGKPLKSADRGDLDLPDREEKEEGGLNSEEADALCGWLKSHLGDRVGSVRASKRLVNNPAAIVTDGPFTASMQRIMMAMNREKTLNSGALTLEVNPRSSVIARLNELRSGDESFARLVADQLFDNAMLAAGLLLDPRGMADRLNSLLERATGTSRGGD